MPCQQRAESGEHIEINPFKQALNLEEMQKYLSSAVKSNSINTMMICQIF